MSSNGDEDDGKVVKHPNYDKVRQAGLNPEKPKAKGKKGSGEPPPPPPEKRVDKPGDFPVTCLGRVDLTYYFVDAKGHFIELTVNTIQRLQITALFNGQEYLVKHFPVYKKIKDEEGEWHWVPQRHGWDHNGVADLLIRLCQEAGAWSPHEKIRGPGCWCEGDELIFHAGNYLWTSKGHVLPPGVRGKLLYPTAPPLPPPIRGAPSSEGADDFNSQWTVDDWTNVDGPGARIMERLVTWNFARPMIDPIIIVGEIASGLLGGALDWRPMLCIKGDSRTGKSSLLDGIKAIFGPDAFLSSGNATRAALANMIGYSTKPVILDEFERGNNDRQNEAITQFMTLASSGGTLDRSSSGHETYSFQARNCFILSAINLPGLTPAELNRVFIVELNMLDHPAINDISQASGEGGGVHKVWGSLGRMTRIGQELRGRLLDQWPRWRLTLNAYQIALNALGHDRRQADQFGTALAAYDLVMHNDYDGNRVKRLTSWLPAASTSETSDVQSHGQQCLDYMLEQMVGVTRGGLQRTVLEWIKLARKQESDDAKSVLAQHGMRVGLLMDFVEDAEPKDAFYVAIATAHSGTAKLVENTSWYKKAGGTSGYVDVLKRLPGAMIFTPTRERIRIQINGKRTYVVLLPYELLFD